MAMPWAAKYALARSKNPEAVSLRSSPRIWRVRQPAVIVDGVVDERVPAAVFVVVAVADRASELAVPTAVGDPTEFLDVDVNQIPGPFVLVAPGRGSAYCQSGVLVEVTQ